MLSLATGVFVVLHGLVHLWYVVLSQGWVELEDQMGWNGYSWLLSPLLPTGTVLSVGSVLYVAVALGFVAGGAGYVLRQDWAVSVIVAAAVISSVVLVAMWDGEPTLLVEKGVLGVLINGALVSLLAVR